MVTERSCVIGTNVKICMHAFRAAIVICPETYFQKFLSDGCTNMKHGSQLVHAARKMVFLQEIMPLATNLLVLSQEAKATFIFCRQGPEQSLPAAWPST